MLTTAFFFELFSILLIISSFMVIYSQHPIFSLLFLISCFLISSILLFILECEFLALMFIIVYVGAIAILFLFAVMMLDMKFINLSKNRTQYFPIGMIFGFTFLIPLYYEISKFDSFINMDTSLYYTDYKNWYSLLFSSHIDIEAYGKVLYSYYVLQFLIIGLILLLVLIGAVYLTNSYNSNESKDQVNFKQLARNSKFFY